MRSNEEGIALFNLPSATRSMRRGVVPRGTCVRGEERLHDPIQASKGFKGDGKRIDQCFGEINNGKKRRTRLSQGQRW